MKILTILGVAALAVGLIALSGHPPTALASASPAVEVMFLDNSPVMALFDQVIMAIVLAALIVLLIWQMRPIERSDRTGREHDGNIGSAPAGEPRPPG